MLGKSSRTSLTVRTAVLLLAALQLGVSGVLPVADAWLDAEPSSAPMHVESLDNEGCDAHHDHLFCQVVRSLAVGLLSPAPHSGRLAQPDEIDGLEHADCAVCRVELRPGAAQPRAPPLV